MKCQQGWMPPAKPSAIHRLDSGAGLLARRKVAHVPDTGPCFLELGYPTPDAVGKLPRVTVVGHPPRLYARLIVEYQDFRPFEQRFMIPKASALIVDAAVQHAQPKAIWPASRLSCPVEEIPDL